MSPFSHDTCFIKSFLICKNKRLTPCRTGCEQPQRISLLFPTRTAVSISLSLYYSIVFSVSSAVDNLFDKIKARVYTEYMKIQTDKGVFNIRTKKCVVCKYRFIIHDVDSFDKPFSKVQDTCQACESIATRMLSLTEQIMRHNYIVKREKEKLDKELEAILGPIYEELSTLTD